MPSYLDLSPDLVPLGEFIGESLIRVQHVFDEQLRSDLPPVSRLCRHIENYRGKMLRPTLVLLSGLAAHPRAGADSASLLTQGHYVVAAVCEMVHMATLVHDDVLDEADTRRRAETVNRLHGNEAAVILGDYLIAAAYHLCSTLPTQAPSLAVGRASMVMCSGELLQLHHRDDFSIDEPTYFEILGRKTAELIATAAELGAAQSGADERACASMAEFGRKLGVAFQIQDDLLDLMGKEAVVGKSVGKDLEKGKMTLPMIHHLAQCDLKARGRTLRLLESACAGGRLVGAGARGEEPPEVGAALMRALEETDSIAYSRRVAEGFVGSAVAAISGLQDTSAKKMLLAMADAVVAREF